MTEQEKKREKFCVELGSVWSCIDIDSYPDVSDIKGAGPPKTDSSPVGKGQVLQESLKKAKAVPSGTPLLSMEQFLPDSAPSSSYGCGEARSDIDSAEKRKQGFGEVPHLPYSINSLGINHSDTIYN
eukprot:gene14279-16416_t